MLKLVRNANNEMELVKSGNTINGEVVDEVSSVEEFITVYKNYIKPRALKQIVNKYLSLYY